MCYPDLLLAKHINVPRVLRLSTITEELFGWQLSYGSCKKNKPDLTVAYGFMDIFEATSVSSRRLYR